jgi:hypothetical protein
MMRWNIFENKIAPIQLILIKKQLFPFQAAFPRLMAK